MFVEYPTLEQARERALQLAERCAYPILISRGQWGLYRIGSRTEPAQRAYGEHVETAHRSGLVEPCGMIGLSSARDIEARRRGNPPCLCLHGDALDPYIARRW